MSAFSSFSGLWQTMIPLVLFCEAVLEARLFLYRLFYSRKRLLSLPCAVNFILLVTVLLSVTQGDPDEGKDAFLLSAPWLIFVAVIVFAAFHFVNAFQREYRYRQNELSPFSVKEATDKLPMGICFAAPDGRIILCNYRMRRLSFALSGHELQVSEDLESALSNPNPAVTADGDCYVMPDQTVWQFKTQKIMVDGDNRWQQMTAYNVTELYYGNLRQAGINKALQEVNGKLQKMYERMADDIKEKESLDLKIYIHDTIGRSLLTIRDMIDNGENAEKKMEALQEAVGVLASDRVATHGTMEEVRQTAKELGVTVKTEGHLPRGSLVEELTIAAAKECVTNCVKHAKGNEIEIRIVGDEELYEITITNNGTVPAGPIREGSGLTSLRRRIETAHGEMHTAYQPRFALRITLSGKENAL